jgi:DNA-binding GntR family transcriptional regulator
MPQRHLLTDQVRDYIRIGIAEGRFLPGDSFREGDIADSLKVSRTPIREAVRILETEGLIAREPWKGITIASLSHKQISNFYNFREIIEGVAAEMAANLITDDDIERLRKILELLKHGFEKSWFKMGRENEQFHEMIFDIAGNKYLKKSEQVINTAKILIRKPVYRNYERWKEAQVEHRKIFNALRARDPIAAKAAAREHARNSGFHRVAVIASEELELYEPEC